jgi:RecB family endonuclease NucS
MAWEYPSILHLKRNEVEDVVVMREKQGKQSTVSADQLVRYLQRFTTQYDAANY